MLKELDNRLEVCYVTNNKIDKVHIQACDR